MLQCCIHCITMVTGEEQSMMTTLPFNWPISATQAILKMTVSPHSIPLAAGFLQRIERESCSDICTLCLFKFFE